MPIRTAMASSSWRAVGRSTILGMGSRLLGGGLDALFHAPLALFPGGGSHGNGLTTVERFGEFRFDGQAGLALLLFPQQLAEELAGGPIAALTNLLFDPLLENRGKGDIHARSH